jgi:protein-disulfide isomerase-like protein with CxxC motif
LLDDNQNIVVKELRIKETVQRGTYVEGLTIAQITDVSEIVKLLSLGEKNRHVNSTKQNRNSSRSHSICTIEIKTKLNRSLINLVDLAGSERVSKSYAKGNAL